jgi:hypothetical protein
MKKILFIIFIVSLSFSSWCQTISYNLSSIPDSIKKNANVIVQLESQIFTIDDIDDATLHVHRIFTVVNEDGKSELNFHEYTTKYISLGDVDIKVYDANGRQLSKQKKKDLTTQAIGEGLVDDGYVVYTHLNQSVFPVTVELEYDLKYKGTLIYPSYNILKPEMGILQSSFVAKVPVTLDLRHRSKNISLQPVVKDEGKFKTYTWEVKNMIPVQYEEGAVDFNDRFPSIELAPNKFSIYGYSGDLSSWKNYGLWIQQLYTGLDQLSESRKAFFIDLVKDAKDDREKIRRIYDYLQKNFRYVSIQLGIGGLKPFSAEFTDQKKYGDCKALSNFMKAALNSVGIKSNIAIINAGYNSMPVDPGFPQQGFDHVILCVPQKNDSIWLECTSSTIDFAELSTFTENRYALLITDNGGVLVPTPSSNPKANVQSAVTTIWLKEDGSGKTQTIFRSKGEYREMMDEILKSKIDEQKEAVVFGLSFKQPDNFEFIKKEEPGVFSTELKMEIEKVPDFIAGSKIFLPPRIYKIWSRKLPKSENRKLDFYFRYPFEETDTTIYVLPTGYKVDVLPPAKELKNEYASYQSKSWYDETQKAICTSVQINLKQHVIPAAKYADMKKFFDDVLINDGQKVVVKKE